MPSPVAVFPQRPRSESPVGRYNSRRALAFEPVPRVEQESLKSTRSFDCFYDRCFENDDDVTACPSVDGECIQSTGAMRKRSPSPGQSAAQALHPLFSQGKANGNGNGNDMLERLMQLEMRLERWHQQHERHLAELAQSVQRESTRLKSKRERLKSARKSCRSFALPGLPKSLRSSEWAGSTELARASSAERESQTTKQEDTAEEDSERDAPALSPPLSPKAWFDEKDNAAGNGTSSFDNAAGNGSFEKRGITFSERESVQPVLSQQAEKDDGGSVNGERRSKTSENENERQSEIEKKRQHMNRSPTSLKIDKSSVLNKIIKHPQFDHFFAGFIVLNAIFIAIQTEYLMRTTRGPSDPSVITAFFAIDKVFATVFLMELMIRIVGLRREFFSAQYALWNIFDTVLVVMSLIEVILETRGFDADEEVGNSATAKVMKTFRMARVVRVMRVLRFLDDLRTMVLLILHSMRSLFWLMVLLGIILFVFAIFFTQGVADFLSSSSSGELSADVDRVLRYFYGGLADSSFTLFMSITGGVSWIEAVEPLKTAGWELTGLFIIYVSFCVFSVLNIVTGVFVDGAIQRSAQERDKRLEKEKEQKEVYINMLMDLLHEIDSEDTGVITRTMLEDAFKGERVRYTFSVLDIDIHDSNYLFDMLDTDGSGEVDMEEFVVGCLRLKGNAKSIDIHTLMFEIRHLMRRWDVLFNEE